MVVKKFQGASTREVLKQVRDELGPDALILSNRQLPDGHIEIMAVSDTEVASLGSSSLAAKPAPRATLTPPKAPAAANRAVQRTYALPPELDDDDEEPTLADIRPPARPAPTTPTMMAMPRLGGDVLPDDHPAVVSPTSFTPRYRYEPPEQDQPQGHRVEPTLAPAEAAPATAPVHAPPPAPPAITREPVHPVPDMSEHGKKIENISHEVEDISSEIKMLRSLLEGQLAGLAWNELKRHAPERLEVLRRLLSVGFSPALSRQIVEHMPSGYSTERGMKWARTALQHNLPTVGPGADIVEAGGVYALVGPTGVGKTTTVAKLAARATLKHGAAKVALITTDGYRIGAQDQLRIYGKILGVPVYAVTDETDLAQTLADLRNRHLVLIDTVGMGQRDQRVVEQIALLAGQTTPVKRLLLLSANAQGTTLDDVVRRYHGEGLSGCIFTKTDEAFSLGSGLDVIVRYKLPLYYITNGQRVPEDLHVASGLYLVDRVFKTPPEAPAYRLKNEEYPLFLGAQQPSLDFSWREAAA
ncbi:flagellar biosynthesis regulator FlhF [Chitinimonas prasina]|uniref:Flagellar biosynthesis protein FlhF n=1 Tax=Chitinimonas prasina TaxID=1434937 RepID=A0ABQ5YK40_9NEIS|nr:flagellar biosynthesis protein FlhF [Chitinimonas prasina]GLR14314.1 flagellar biosynthesis regulator FlhF [Chitinimonas prasina]